MSVILLVYSLALLVITCAICIYIGIRRGTFNSALRFGFFLVSGILAFIIMRLLSPVLGNALVDALGSMAEEITFLLENPALRDVLKKVLGGIVAPLVFLPLFFVIDKLTFFAYVPLRKKFADREPLHNIPHDKVFGGVLGGVLAFCITLSCVMPIGGYPQFVSQTLNQIGNTTLTKELVPEDVKSSVDEVAGYGIVKADYAVSGWLFNGLTADTRAFVTEAANLITVADRVISAQNPEEALDALQQVPPQTIATFASVIKSSVTDLVSDSDSPFSGLAGLLLDGLQDLPKLQESLSEEEYKRELQLVSTLVTAAQNPKSIKTKELLKTAVSSKIVQNIIVTNSDAVAAEISALASTMSAKEKKEVKQEIQEYFEQNKVSDDVENAVYRALGLQ